MYRTSCPERKPLRKLVLGQLSEVELCGISEHLRDCKTCENTTRLLDSTTDELIASLRVPVTSIPFRAEAGCELAITNAQCVVNATLDFANVKDGFQIGSSAPETLDAGSETLPREFGAYVLLRKIGSGGMGTVFEAEHRRLGKRVAVKVLSQGRLGDPNALARFEREMRAIGKLDHPNIVTAFDAGEIDNTPFLAMEFIEGEDLKQIQKLFGRLPISHACEIVRQVALGLQYVNDNEFVHRDIKPANIMLTKVSGVAGARVRILDLGLARFDGVDTTEADLTSSGQVVGTLEYMAPEHMDGSTTVDIRADIYSLGAALYRLLTGCRHLAGHDGESTLQRLHTLATKAPETLSSKRTDIPQALSALVMRMLSRSPNDRPSTPGEVAEALTSFTGNADPCRLLDRDCATSQVIDAVSYESNGSPFSVVPWAKFVGIASLAVVAGFVALDLPLRDQDARLTPAPVESALSGETPQTPIQSFSENDFHFLPSPRKPNAEQSDFHISSVGKITGLVGDKPLSPYSAVNGEFKYVLSKFGTTVRRLEVRPVGPDLRLVRWMTFSGEQLLSQEHRLALRASGDAPLELRSSEVIDLSSIGDFAELELYDEGRSFVAASVGARRPREVVYGSFDDSENLQSVQFEDLPFASGLEVLTVAGERCFAIGSVQEVIIVSATRGVVVDRYPVVGAVNDLDLSPNSELLAVGCNRGDGRSEVIRAIDGQSVAELSDVAPCIVRFSPDGSSLVTHGQNGMCVFNTSDWSTANRWPEMSCAFTGAVGFSSSRSLWAVRSRSGRGTLLQLQADQAFDTSQAIALLPFTHRGAFAEHPTMPWMAVAGGPGYVLVFETKYAQLIAVGFAGGLVHGATFTTDGESLISIVSHPAGLVMWDVADLIARTTEADNIRASTSYVTRDSKSFK